MKTPGSTKPAARAGHPGAAHAQETRQIQACPVLYLLCENRESKNLEWHTVRPNPGGDLRSKEGAARPALTGTVFQARRSHFLAAPQTKGIRQSRSASPAWRLDLGFTFLYIEQPQPPADSFSLY